mgnify:CR=1 FL=1
MCFDRWSSESSVSTVFWCEHLLPKRLLGCSYAVMLCKHSGGLVLQLDDKQQFFNANSTANKEQNEATAPWQRNFHALMFHQWSRCDLHKFESCEHHTTTKTFHVLLNVPMRLTFPLARLLTRCACFVIVTCSCCCRSARLHNVVTEHGVGTQHLVLFLCSGFNPVSSSLWCTAVLGLELGTRLWFVDWITDEIALLSLTFEVRTDDLSEAFHMHNIHCGVNSQCTVSFWPGKFMTKGCFNQSNSGAWKRCAAAGQSQLSVAAHFAMKCAHHVTNNWSSRAQLSAINLVLV